MDSISNLNRHFLGIQRTLNKDLNTTEELESTAIR